jgi:hypothetical protein
MSRLVSGCLLAALILACSSGPAAPTEPGATATPGGAPTSGVPTVPPAGTPPPGGQTASEALVRSLVPPGSTEVQYVASGDAYALYLSNASPIDQLEAFFDQTIPARGVTVSGKSEVSGILIYSLENPVGGITVTPADNAGYLILISLGTS